MYKFLKISHFKKVLKWLKLITEFGKVSGTQFVLFLCSCNKEYKKKNLSFKKKLDKVVHTLTPASIWLRQKIVNSKLA